MVGEPADPLTRMQHGHPVRHPVAPQESNFRHHQDRLHGRTARTRGSGLALVMDWFVKAFIRASLLWFAAGILLGVAMAIHPPWVIYRPAHAHMNVVGFLTMLVFGVGYQLLPRLFGHPLHSKRLAIWHFFLANAGLAALVAGFALQPHVTRARWLSATGGAVFSLGALFWVWNLWHTFNAADARARARAQSGRASLPTTDD